MFVTAQLVLLKLSSKQVTWRSGLLVLGYMRYGVIGADVRRKVGGQ